MKQLVPDMVDVARNEQEYNLVKSAFKNLIQAGKNKDGLIVDFYDGYFKGFEHLDIRVKQIGNKVQDFLYPDVSKEYDRFGSDIDIFHDKCQFINSPDFKQESEKVIENWGNHRTSQSKWKNFKGDVAEAWEDIKENIEDFVECCFSIVEDGKTGKLSWEPIDLLKEWVASKKYDSEVAKKYPDKIEELKSLADEMRVK